MIDSSIQADLATLHQCVTGIRERRPLDADLSEEPPALDAIKQDLTRIVSLAMRTGIAMATSRWGVMAVNHRNCFAILASEGIIDADLADALTTAVNSWALLATEPDEIDRVIVDHFCGYFLMDFEKYVQAIRSRSPGISYVTPCRTTCSP